MVEDLDLADGLTGRRRRSNERRNVPAWGIAITTGWLWYSDKRFGSRKQSIPIEKVIVMLQAPDRRESRE